MSKQVTVALNANNEIEVTVTTHTVSTMSLEAFLAATQPQEVAPAATPSTPEPTPNTYVSSTDNAADRHQ